MAELYQCRIAVIGGYPPELDSVVSSRSLLSIFMKVKQ